MGFEIEQDNSKEILEYVKQATKKALEIIGQKAETYAKKLCPVGTVESTGKKGYRGGTLRNSITHEVEEDEVVIGSNVEYAPYVELGTGPYFTPPPEWETFETERGSGISHAYVHARPYLRPAVIEHLEEYKNVIKGELGE